MYTVSFAGIGAARFVVRLHRLPSFPRVSCQNACKGYALRGISMPLGISLDMRILCEHTPVNPMFRPFPSSCCPSSANPTSPKSSPRPPLPWQVTSTIPVVQNPSRTPPAGPRASPFASRSRVKVTNGAQRCRTAAMAGRVRKKVAAASTSGGQRFTSRGGGNAVRKVSITGCRTASTLTVSSLMICVKQRVAVKSIDSGPYRWWGMRGIWSHWRNMWTAIPASCAGRHARRSRRQKGCGPACAR